MLPILVVVDIMIYATLIYVIFINRKAMNSMRTSEKLNGVLKE